MTQVVKDSFISVEQSGKPPFPEGVSTSYILPIVEEKNMPPTLLKRNSAGLLENVKYQFKDNGAIDWRAMVPSEFLVPNRTNFIKKNLPVPETIEGLEDRDLLVLLGGIREVATIRGFNLVDPNVIKADENEVVVKTTIEFIANYETNGRAVRFAALASANHQNTNGFGKIYLAPIAENRGFIRAVRGFLGINVVGNDEIAPATTSYEEHPKTNSGIKPLDKLKQYLTSNNIKFSNFKKLMVKNKIDGAGDWGSIDNVPTGEIFACLGHLKEALEKA